MKTPTNSATKANSLCPTCAERINDRKARYSAIYGTQQTTCEKCGETINTMNTIDTPRTDRIKQDIKLAKEWAAPFRVITQPGNGEGWRHTCYRLAMEVERLERELSQWREVADGLASLDTLVEALAAYEKLKAGQKT